MTIFAHRLKILRKAKKLNQIKFGELIDASQGHISSYEVGRVHPIVQGLVEIANVFDTTTDYLLGLTNNSTRDPMYETRLNPTQQELIDIIQSCDEDFQRKLLTVARLFDE